MIRSKKYALNYYTTSTYTHIRFRSSCVLDYLNIVTYSRGQQ